MTLSQHDNNNRRPLDDIFIESGCCSPEELLRVLLILNLLPFLLLTMTQPQPSAAFLLRLPFYCASMMHSNATVKCRQAKLLQKTSIQREQARTHVKAK
ncbi:MAG: hypothetical protein VKK59_05440 [Vampirovibrionales bacterium]|nr:hypothetical protein [Vampirovibrionales bacterium]